MQKADYKGRIANIEKVSFDVFRIEITSDLKEACPGQFISILCPNKTLRRPFSICDFDENKKTTSILVKLKGEGTSYLQGLKKDDEIDFLAPLGNGFALLDKKALLIGAGIGIAPMLFLKKELDKKNIENYFISGFKKEAESIPGADKTLIGGSVLDNLEDLIRAKKTEIIYACGPQIVLKNIAKIAQKMNIPSKLALERVMACSIGVCRGCTIRLSKNNDIIQASVCKDGPVFLGSEVIWD